MRDRPARILTNAATEVRYCGIMHGGGPIMDFITKPEVVRSYFDTTVQPQIAAMDLRWDPDAPGVADRTWHLPDGVSVKGPAPEQFGVTIQRRGPNAYQVRVLWNQLSL